MPELEIEDSNDNEDLQEDEEGFDEVQGLDEDDRALAIEQLEILLPRYVIHTLT